MIKGKGKGIPFSSGNIAGGGEDDNMFINGEFNNTLDPWIQSGDTYVWLDGMCHTDTPTVAGGDALFQNFSGMIAGEVYELSCDLVNGTAPNWLFEDIITDIPVTTTTQFVVAADGDYSIGFVAPVAGLGFDIDNMRMEYIGMAVFHDGEVVTHDGEIVIYTP